MAPERPVNRYAPSMPLHKVRRRRRTYASNVPIFGIVAVSCSAVLAATHAAAYLTTSSTARHVFTCRWALRPPSRIPCSTMLMRRPIRPVDSTLSRCSLVTAASPGTPLGCILSGRNGSSSLRPRSAMRRAQTNTPNHDEPAMLELVALHDDTDVAVLRFTHDELNEDLEESAGGSLGTCQPDAARRLCLCTAT